MKFIKITKRFGLSFKASWDTSAWFITPSLVYQKEWHLTDTVKAFWFRWLVAGVAVVVLDLTKYNTTVAKAEESLTTSSADTKKPEKIRAVSKPVVAKSAPVKSAKVKQTKPVAKKATITKVAKKAKK